jgi:hypothetical protein
MLHPGFGDHQVADVTPEVEARTIGARIHRPALDPDRPRFQGRPAAENAKAFFGIPSIPYAGGPPGSWDGSALVYWDIGPLRPAGCEAAGPPDCDGVTPPPPLELPNRQGLDPHEFPRRAAAARLMKSNFLRVGGSVTDVCGGPCYAGTWTGP